MEVEAPLPKAARDTVRVFRTGLSFAVCTNRPANLGNAVSVARALRESDELLVIVDLAPEEVPPGLGGELPSLSRVRILQNPGNSGLSYGRNRALEVCTNVTLVFVDDDVTVSAATVEAIRVACNEGTGIVGVLLVPQFRSARRRWWLNGGQYHYLGVHHRADSASPWGACMAVDAALASARGIRFREDLGRRRRRLQSGDDTTFLAELRAAGASQRILTHVSATHHISPERERLSYLLRRAWWQGRSERRRRSLLSALHKEWRRNVGTGPAQATFALRYTLGVLFVSAVAVGGLSEVLSASRGRENGGSG
jgi:glycosyltransferase involved in cell wall biosynthesis